MLPLWFFMHQRPQTVAQRVADWRTRLSGAPGVLLYHRDAIYLLDRFGVPLLGTIEAVPGVPPSAQDVLDLTTALQGRAGVVIHAPYQSPQAAAKLAHDLGWRVVRLPLAPPLDADGNGYLAHIERWVTALAAARR